MNRPIFLLLPALGLLLGGCSLTSHEPENLTIAKQNAEKYAAEYYQADLEAVAAKADAWVAGRSARGGKLAIVFDIDETTLSNFSHMKEEDWGYQPEIWGRWVTEASATAIIPVRKVYQTALANNVSVFFITGRRENEGAATARNLKSQGMGTYQKLVLKPLGMKGTAADYKAPQRRLIEEQGYTIIANIGDQQSDLDGGYSERTFKLPNPFYFIP